MRRDYRRLIRQVRMVSFSGLHEQMLAKSQLLEHLLFALRRRVAASLIARVVRLGAL